MPVECLKLLEKMAKPKIFHSKVACTDMAGQHIHVDVQIFDDGID